MFFTVIAAIILVLFMIVLGVLCGKNGFVSKHAKKLFGVNVGILFSLLAVITIMLFSGASAAAAATVGEASREAGAVAADNSRGLAYLGAALSTGLATIGAGIAVAITGSAALGAISEDQSLLGKSLIFVGLAEGIAIYGLIISILILGQL